MRSDEREINSRHVTEVVGNTRATTSVTEAHIRVALSVCCGELRHPKPQPPTLKWRRLDGCLWECGAKDISQLDRGLVKVFLRQLDIDINDPLNTSSQRPVRRA